MSNYIKNVSGRTIIISDLNMVWAMNKVFDLDDIDNELLAKGVDSLQNIVDKGWIVPCDEDGNVKSNKVSIRKVSEERKKELEQRMEIVEYANKRDEPDFDPDELKKIGETFVLGGKVRLKTFLLMHHSSAMRILKSERRTLEDLEGLKLIYRHDHRRAIHEYLRGLIWRIENPKTKKK